MVVVVVSEGHLASSSPTLTVTEISVSAAEFAAVVGAGASSATSTFDASALFLCYPQESLFTIVSQPQHLLLLLLLFCFYLQEPVPALLTQPVLPLVVPFLQKSVFL